MVDMAKKFRKEDLQKLYQMGDVIFLFYFVGVYQVQSISLKQSLKLEERFELDGELKESTFWYHKWYTERIMIKSTNKTLLYVSFDQTIDNHNDTYFFISILFTVIH